MVLGANKKEDHEPIIIEIAEFENINIVLSKLIVPFSEVMGSPSVPDVYIGHEKIPFEKLYPLYQTIMRQEFADAMKTIKKGT